MKTKIYTRPVYDYDPNRCKKAKLVFDGDLAFQFRREDGVVIVPGGIIERVDYVSYSIPDNEQEIHLVTTDEENIYPSQS
jgi:hypothetical protein